MIAAGSDPFWDWSVRAWRDARVESLCLELQDRHDVFVPALLLAFWCTAMGRPLPQDFSRDLRLADWHTRVLGPLRAMRREFAGRQGREAPAYARYRQLELRLERLLMARMQGQLTGDAVPGRAGDDSLLAGNLVAALEQVPEAAQEDLAALAARLLPSGPA